MESFLLSQKNAVLIIRNTVISIANIRHDERKVSANGAVRYSGLVSSNLLQELDLARRRKVGGLFFYWNFSRYGAECTGSIKIHLARGEETLESPHR